MTARSRVLYGVASQGVTSLTNFLVIILLARTQSPEVVGAWTLGFAIVTFATTLGRATYSTPIVLTGADTPERDVSGGLSLSLAAGVGTGAVVGCMGLVGLVPLDVALAIGLSAIFVLAQDFLRYSWIARSRPRNALVLDSVWLVFQIVATVAISVANLQSAASLTLAWGGGAAASLAAGFIIDRHARISLRLGREFVATHRGESGKLLGESLANSLSANLQPFVVAGFAGLAAAGALRVAQTLFAPLTTLVAGLSPVVLRELSRRLTKQQSTARIRITWQVGLTALNLTYGAILIFLPESVGVALAGETWGLASVLVIPLAVQALIRPQLTIATLSLRARRRLSLLRTSSWVFLVPSALLPGVGGLLWGLAGIGWGLVIDISIRAIFYTVCLWRVGTLGRR